MRGGDNPSYQATKEKTMKVRFYDQAPLCQPGCCPVADYDDATGQITLSDPAAPEQGKFTFKNRAQFETFVANISKVEIPA